MEKLRKVSQFWGPFGLKYHWNLCINGSSISSMTKPYNSFHLLWWYKILLSPKRFPWCYLIRAKNLNLLWLENQDIRFWLVYCNTSVLLPLSSFKLKSKLLNTLLKNWYYLKHLFQKCGNFFFFPPSKPCVPKSVEITNQIRFIRSSESLFFSPEVGILNRVKV